MLPQQIRQHYRRLRAALTPSQQESNAVALANHIDEHLGYSKPLKIAAYLATGGEISLAPWIDRQGRHQVYLPKLYEPIEPRLRFAPVTPHTRWIKNRFNIIEPLANWGNTLHARELDLILLPLVAFDSSGNRLGMGGGYYDRSLSFRRHREHWKKPRLIGVAHGLQQCAKLTSNQWDVPLDAIITEQGLIRAQRSAI